MTEESIPAAPLEIHINVEERLLTGDVNRDGIVKYSGSDSRRTAVG